MSRRKPFRAPFVVTVSAAVAAAAPLACGGQAFEGDAASGGSAGASGGSAGAAGSAGSSGSSGSGASGGAGGSAGGTGGSAGISGSGGSGGTAGHGHGGSGGMPGCPPSIPPGGTKCASDGMVCTYDQGPCCPRHEARCVGGLWESEIWSCNPPPPDPCPGELPPPGAPCGPVSMCGVPADCWWTCPGGGAAHAWCDGSAWQVDSVCGPGCDEIAKSLRQFADANRACMVDADCTSLMGVCADGADFCDGTFYVATSASADEFRRIADDLLACYGSIGQGCAVCDAIAPPPACRAGTCVGAF